MKKYLRENKYQKLFQRGTSLLLSAIMLISSLSVFIQILSEENLFVAYAAEPISITTVSDLVTYSKSYNSTHAQDILNITISTTNATGAYQTSATKYSYDEFVSIGADESSAFKGTINITIEAISYFNFNKPVFKYIADSAKINVIGSSDGYFELRNPSSGNLLPVLAENVVHDTNYTPASENDYTNWKIKLNYYNEDGDDPVYSNFPCVIGSVGDNCKLKLDIQNNTINGDYKENIEATSSGANAGLICGTLGDNASLIATVSGTNTSFTVTSASGHAGALIGEMKFGSSLKLSGTNITGGTNRTITATNGYAGGLVGKATDCTIEFDNSYIINERISGKLGAGGIAGYYKSETGNTFNLNLSNISCSLTSASAGGLFGILETAGDFTLNETGSTYTITSTATGQASGSYYGGLIGTYKTNVLTNTLTIGDIAVTANSGGNGGGLIGKLDDTSASYIAVNGASVNSTVASGFYGVVNNAGNAGHFLDIGNFTLNGSNAGGLVGTIGTGVIRLSGTTDLSGASGSSNAQLVNKRGNALIYAVGDGNGSGWTFKRCPAVAHDDIGNWGEVLRISDINEFIPEYTEDNTTYTDTTPTDDKLIITFNHTAHTATIAAPTTSTDSETNEVTATIATVNDFIRTALNMQINQGNRGALLFAESTNTSSVLLGSLISITADIDLAGTGIMGLMRDDGKQNVAHSTTETDAAFAGTVNGNNHTVSLAIGEPYGMRFNYDENINNYEAVTAFGTGNGTLHNHAKGGLLAVTNGATVSNLTIGGTIYTESSNNGMCLGGFVGHSKGSLTISGIDATLLFTGNSRDANAKYFGGVIGKAEGDSATVSISGNNHSIITTSAYSEIYASNSIGYVGDNTITINFSNYTLGKLSTDADSVQAASISNPSTSTQDDARCGGLIGYINGITKAKTVNIDDTVINQYNLNLTSNVCAGGLLGYAWDNTEVNIGDTGTTGTTGIVVSNCFVSQKSASAGGLVHSATGHWAVTKLQINDTNFDLNGTNDFGVLVNKGYHQTTSKDDVVIFDSALFMELKSAFGSGNGFDLSDDVIVNESGTSALTVYDELVAYSSPDNVLKEGNSVVSVHTPSGTVVGGKYENQITAPNSLNNNNHTRYYYDLDVIRSAVADGTYPTGSTTAEQNAYKLMMWNLKQYAHSTIQGYFDSSNNASELLTGDYDLSKVSYYPLNRSDAISIGAASFTFNNKNIEDSDVAGTTYRSTMNSNSQHYLMHSGLFYDVTGSISITDNLTLSGSIGRHENGSGAIVSGTLGNLTDGTTNFGNTEGKLITLNGLTVNFSDTYTPEGSATAVNTYKPVLINRIGNHVSLSMNGVNTTSGSYADGNDIKMAGSSLIGTVGTKDNEGRATSDSINLTFNDIRLDARTDSNKNDSNLSGLTTVYGTTKSVLTKATLLDEFIFNNNTDCKGVYNYKLSEDWNSDDSSAVHHVTYGYEIDRTSEFSGMQNHYVDMLGKTNPETYAKTQDENISYNFSYFLPYVAVRNYDEEDATKRSRELMVNHTNVSITKGCGTYNDPYIIEENGQIEAIAKILELGNVNDGFTINIPLIKSGNYKKWCDNDHIQLTFDSSLNSGTYKASDTTYNRKKEQLAEYLAGAYYKITKVAKTTGEDENAVTTYSSITISSTAFNGLGGTEDKYAFRGVIIGDTDTATYPLVNNTGAPLIKTSYGSVVKNLKINVRNSNITKSQDNKDQKFLISGGCSNYGAVIGQILGGDNIIDTVTVDYTGATIKLEGTSVKIIPIGGYVGVVASGALIFKGTNTGGLTTGIVKNNNVVIDMTDTNWLYVNPIVGRVLNGYAVYEAASNANSDDYKYSESTVTMKNGTKNYSIADIDPDFDKLEVSAYTKIGTSNYYTTDVTIPNAQAMYVLSLLTQSSTIGNNKYSSPLKVVDSDSYSSYKMMRHAKYDKVGTTDNSDYTNYAQYDTSDLGNVQASTGFKYTPYLVEKFTSTVDSLYYVLSLTRDTTVCNMTLSGSDTNWYLPDGFKGIGYLGYGQSSYENKVINLHKFAGGDKIIHLNMSLKHYSANVDNYFPCSNSNSSQTNTGFGLFNILRHNWKDQGTITAENLETDAYKIKNLNLTGTIDYDVVDITTYSSENVYNSKYVDVGGFAGYCGLGAKNDLRIETIDLSGLTVNGFKTAGGLFGYLKMYASADYLAKISDITATTSTLTVTSKQYVGGIVGRAEQIGLTIEDMIIDNLSVLTDNNGKTNYSNGVGGVIGQITNFDSNKNSTFGAVTLNNITIGDKDATTNLRFGYRVNATLVDSNDYNRIAVGGLIGQSKMDNIKNTSEYGLIVSNCSVYNVDLYGHRVGGILGHDSDGTDGGSSRSNISFQNDHVISTNSASINGLTFYNNRQNRGCGGIAGYIKNDSYKVLFEDCSVEGYLLRSYNDTGGLSSNIQSSGSITLKNIMLKDLQIQSCYHGALFGYLNKPTNGYNVLVDNIQFSKYDNKNYIDNKYGYLVGNNGGVKIQLVGVSRQHLENTSADHIDKIAGKSGNYNYGTNGYIIWADTLGKCTATATAGTKQSDLTSTDKTTVNAKSPWVTVSPSINISGTDAEETQVLTGDSIMANFAAADALSVSTLADVNSNAKTTYKNYKEGTNNKPKLFSTYETEMGVGSLPEGVSDFPVIAIDRSGLNDDINNAFKSYVQLLTHTTFNYARDIDNSTSTYNYRVKIYRCTYDDTTHTFYKTDGSTGLWLDTSSNKEGFKTDITKPDTDAETACFTLVDVQFFNPSNNNEIAYHVYVPVLIKKLMKFEFRASSLPGTVYDYTNYVYKTSSRQIEDKWGTPSVTNLGTPVTVFFRYDYVSTVAEWQAMIDSGESLMWHANKRLLMKTASENLPQITRMILVDANDKDRIYYAKASDSGVFTKNENSSQNDYYIDLTKFKSGSDIFTSVNYGEKLSVTASTTVRTGSKAYVQLAKDEGTGEYIGSVYAMAKINGTGEKVAFRPATDSENADNTIQKYYLTVDGTSDQPPAGLSESYYITFFTNTNNSESLRVILTGSAPALTSSPQNNDVISHTFRCIFQRESALILGNIYKQEFTKFETENSQYGLVNNGCNYIESDITLEISVNNDNNEADTIIRYLDNDSIKVYHSILLTLTKNDGTTVENTIYGTPTYTIDSSKNGTALFGTISSKLSGSSVSIENYRIDTPTNTSSFIQIQDNDFDIKPLLIEKKVTGSGENQVTTYGGAIVSISGLRTHFDYLNISNQFPYQPSGNQTIGTTVKAISTLDSDQSNVAYSNIREEKSDKHAVRYHSEQPSSATLAYVVDTSDEAEIVKNYNMLGINPIDDSEYLTNIIVAYGTYNAVTFLDSALAGKIRWTLALEKKNEEGFYEQVDMSKYLGSDITVANRGENAKFTKFGDVYIYDEDYTTPMDITKLETVYAMKTGSDLEQITDSKGQSEIGVYTNYKVTLSATLYTGNETLYGLTDVQLSERKVDNSTVSDYIKYTNAKVLSSWVKS